jgi:hypothetical protein
LGQLLAAREQVNRRVQLLKLTSQKSDVLAGSVRVGVLFHHAQSPRIQLIDPMFRFISEASEPFKERRHARHSLGSGRLSRHAIQRAQ